MKISELPKADTCNYCGNTIKVTIFKGTGYCSDNHRKKLHGDDQAHLKPVVYHRVGFKDGEMDD